mmetsp:Transcript_32992/g.78286  ORF Transcript_32992/g.78286 Transcript_32992/m.78286 type:complete len:454 (+) Transcript_32992:167-1528(+)
MSVKNFQPTCAHIPDAIQPPGLSHYSSPDQNWMDCFSSTAPLTRSDITPSLVDFPPQLSSETASTCLEPSNLKHMVEGRGFPPHRNIESSSSCNTAELQIDMGLGHDIVTELPDSHLDLFHLEICDSSCWYPSKAGQNTLQSYPFHDGTSDDDQVGCTASETCFPRGSFDLDIMLSVPDTDMLDLEGIRFPSGGNSPQNETTGILWESSSTPDSLHASTEFEDEFLTVFRPGKRQVRPAKWYCDEDFELTSDNQESVAEPSLDGDAEKGILHPDLVPSPKKKQQRPMLWADFPSGPASPKEADHFGREGSGSGSLHSCGSTASLDILATKRKSNGPGYRFWSLEETCALVQGVEVCGGGKWAEIKKLCFPEIDLRSAVDLKDKWRNLTRIAAMPPERVKIDKKREVTCPPELLAKVRELNAREEEKRQARASKRGRGNRERAQRRARRPEEAA